MWGFIGVAVGVRAAHTGINQPEGTQHNIEKETDYQTEVGSRLAVNTVGRSNVKRVFSKRKNSNQ